MIIYNRRRRRRHSATVRCDNCKKEGFIVNDSSFLGLYLSRQYWQTRRICEKCVRKNNYGILTDTRVKLIEKYMERVEKFGEIIKKLTAKAIDSFYYEITLEFLEKLNPEAVERYKNTRGTAVYEGVRKVADLPHNKYVSEIREDLLEVLPKYIDNYIKESKEYISAKKVLLDLEDRVKKILDEKKDCTEYCYYVFRVSPFALKKLLDIFLLLMRLSLNRITKKTNIYQTIVYSKEKLKDTVYDIQKYEVYTDKKYIGRKKAFKNLLGRIAVFVEKNIV